MRVDNNYQRKKRRKMKVFSVIVPFVSIYIPVAQAWAPSPSRTIRRSRGRLNETDQRKVFEARSSAVSNKIPQQQSALDNLFSNKSKVASMTSAAALTFTPLAAEATSTGYQIESALAAYGHYLSLFVIVGALMYERLTVAPDLSVEKEKGLAIADSLLGVSGLALLVSGYYRATEYGKGWAFYSHEPLFWFKMALVCVFGAASFFPTATIIKRTVAIQTGKDIAPMSEKLANRLISVLNAELLMIASIPLTATLMSRGVLYTESIPFNIIGPVVCVGTIGGLGYKYINEALTWED